MIIRYLLRYFPNLKHDLRVAHMDKTPKEFLRSVLVRSSLYTLLFAVGLAMLFDKVGWPWSWYGITVIGIFAFGFWFGMKRPAIVAYRRAVDINREVLFAGRFLLIKLHSGKPLINSLVEASQSYGVANEYFAEIVRDIDLGTPLEEAIEKAMTYSPSDDFRKILFQIHNALRLGIDVTKSLEAVLDDITHDQLLEIQRYGKKLPTATLFYMIVGVVFPSLGMTILTVLISFTDITMDMTAFGVVILFIVIINVLFITVFRGIRPKVNI